jgi:hypothetical protein
VTFSGRGRGTPRTLVTAMIRPGPRTCSLLLCAAALLGTGADAAAQDAPAEPVAQETAHRASSIEPRPAEPATQTRALFDSDPIADGAIILASVGFAGTLDLINSTGELRPQQIPPNFDGSKLLPIDRFAITQNADESAHVTSNVGLAAALSFAMLDPVLSRFREHDLQSGLVDGILYAESAAITWGLTNLAKAAIRRPRPQAYIDAAAHKNDPNYSNASTDSTLSFFSGHASMTASISATATYLAFARSPGTARPWVTLAVGVALTAFVSEERVRAGAHFPTDVIAGAVAGAGVGIIVPHLHRSEGIKQRRMWVGFAPSESGTGGALQVGGVF